MSVEYMHPGAFIFSFNFFLGGGRYYSKNVTENIQTFFHS